MAGKQPKGIRESPLTKWIFKAKPTLARCGGRGYFIVIADQTVWDVPTVRIECDGCPDCKKERKP